jgi:triosephosphate isomerase
MIILNLKNYTEATGGNLKPVIDDVEDVITQNPEFEQIVYLAPATYDLHFATHHTSKASLMSQHVDDKKVGSSTGRIPPESLKSIGVHHSILNHSEYRLAHMDEFHKAIEQIQDMGIKLVICCENLDEAKKLLELKPFAIAYEDKDLIGSGQSITTGKPEEVKKFIDLVKKKNDLTKAIIGAGISTGEDISQGKEFGADGFILASGFVKAADRKAKLIELADAFI